MQHDRLPLDAANDQVQSTIGDCRTQFNLLEFIRYLWRLLPRKIVRVIVRELGTTPSKNQPKAFRLPR